MFRSLILLALLLPFALAGAAADDTFAHSHQLLDTLLSTHVNEQGMVNYRALHQHPETLDKYLAELGSVSQAQLQSWSREQQLAYWINAYNAYTLKAIIDNYPIEARGLLGLRFPQNSIRQIAGVWDKLTWQAGGEALTLNDMEHKKMRAELDEPRIHFAINCASIGCPEMEQHAFVAGKLEEQLEAATSAFMTNPQKVRVTDEGLYLSKIFEWFHEDFTRYDRIDGYGAYDGVVSFVSRYVPARHAREIRGEKPKIRWLDYDWSLNEWVK